MIVLHEICGHLVEEITRIGQSEHAIPAESCQVNMSYIWIEVIVINIIAGMNEKVRLYFQHRKKKLVAVITAISRIESCSGDNCENDFLRPAVVWGGLKLTLDGRGNRTRFVFASLDDERIAGGGF